MAAIEARNGFGLENNMQNPEGDPGPDAMEPTAEIHTVDDFMRWTTAQERWGNQQERQARMSGIYGFFSVNACSRENHGVGWPRRVGPRGSNPDWFLSNLTPKHSMKEWIKMEYS